MDRVGIYNRCSTEEEAQKNALEIQAQESREIAQNKGWKITAQYIESETGTTIKNRTEYQKMLEDMENDVFDIILIKSIDRLMRSTKDWYIFIDKVVSCNKKLFIYMDNKFYEQNDALVTGIKAILAEDFSRELSRKIKHAHKRRQENKLGLNITKPMYGWDKAAKDTYMINEKEAEYYRLAFSMAYEGHGFYTIARYMYEQGVRSKQTGEQISAVQWRNMLYSPRAHGTVVLHKKEYDFNTKKFIKVPPEKWIYIDNALPPIVSKEYQDMVLTVIKDRTTKCNFKDYTKDMTQIGIRPLSGKLYCGCCGSVYYRWVVHKGKKGELREWKCGTRISRGKDACENINVMEDVILEIVEDISEQYYEMLFDTTKNNLIEETLQIAKKVFESNDTEKTLKKELSEQEKKKSILLDKLAGAVIDDNDFKIANIAISEKIRELKNKIEIAEAKAAELGEPEERLMKIRAFLQEKDIIRKAKAKDMLRKIEKIVVYPDKKLEIQFQQKMSNLTGSNADGIYKKATQTDLEPSFYMDKSFYKMTVPYIHKDNKYRRREQTNKRILEIFKKNPQMKLKDIFQMFDQKESYINTSIKQLKDEGKLAYKRYGNHTGEWIVTETEKTLV